MPDRIVINTGPLLALIAATGNLEILQAYQQVIVPSEVDQEILADPTKDFGKHAFLAASWLTRLKGPTAIPPHLASTLDPGEASVIATALAQGINTVAIDETVGRRIARLHGLLVTGSIGVLIRHRPTDTMPLSQAISRMRQQGIWISNRLIEELRRLGHLESGHDQP